MRPCSMFNLAGLILTLAISSAPPQAQAQPSSIGPQDVAQLKQRTDFTNEWFDTILYDLEHPVELFVTIQGVDIPDVGNAKLLFTIDSIGRGTDETAFDPERVFVATLQLADTVKRLGANSNSFERGVEAQILGWPATPENVTESVLLVDELSFLHGGQPMRFHPDHPNMKTLRAPDSQ